MNQLNDSLESIVNLLLRVGERVVEVSRDKIMTRIWDRDNSKLSAFKSYYTGKHISEIRNDSTVTQCLAGIDRAFATGEDTYMEYVSHNNDVQQVLTFSLRILACHPDKDNFVLLVIENISRGNEHILVEDKWKLALDASEQGVWDANWENKHIFFSDKWQQLFGYNAKEIATIDEWREKIHPADIAVAMQRLQDYFDGTSSTYSAEIRFRCKDGSYRWILSRGVIVEQLPDGKPKRLIGTHTDINDLKNAEEALKEARDTFANSFNYAATGKALIAPGGAWLEVNDTICQLTGYSRDELKKLHYRDITFPEDVDIDLPLIHQLAAGEIHSYSIEKRYVAKNRQVLTTVVTVALVRNSDNSPKYFVCDIVDISAQKQLSNDLERRNMELEATSSDLQLKMKQLKELHDMVAHNLRGPAGNIKMLSDGSDIFPVDESMELIQQASKELLNSLDTLVELSRIRLNQEIRHDLCDITAITRGIKRQLQGVLYQKHIEIRKQFTVKEVSYPRLYLESILYNLISNAVKYSRTDIPTIITVGTKEVNGRVQLTVADNGIGIDLAQHGDEMFKLNQTFHKGYDSKGVGLFLTKTQVESLGGTIVVESKPNEGSTFTVTL